jgi:hypothetical protein
MPAAAHHEDAGGCRLQVVIYAGENRAAPFVSGRAQPGWWIKFYTHAAEQLPSSLSFSCMLMRVEDQYAMEAQRNWPAHRVKEVQPSYLSKYNHV